MSRRRRSGRRASRRSYSGATARGFTSTETLKLTGGAVAGLVAGPIASIQLADALADKKTGKSPVDGPFASALVTAGLGLGGGWLIRKVDKSAGNGFFVGATAGGIATAIIAYAKKEKLFGLSGNDEYVNYTQSPDAQ